MDGEPRKDEHDELAGVGRKNYPVAGRLHHRPDQ